MDVGAVDDLLDPATAGIHDDADPIAFVLVHGREVDARIAHRLGTGTHRQLDEAAHPPGHLRVHDRGRIEVEHLGRDPDLERGGVEALDLARAGHPGHQVRPVRREVIADRHDGPEAGHDGATRGILFRHEASSRLGCH